MSTYSLIPVKSIWLPFCHIAAFTHPIGEIGCELTPRLHWMFINVIPDVAELTQPLQAWNAVQQNAKMGNKNRRHFIKVMFIPKFHPHIDNVWVDIRFKQLA